MSGNQHVVDGASLNDGSSVVRFGVAAFVAAAVISAPITYKFLSSSTANTVAGLESVANQGFAAVSTPVGEAYISDAGYVFKDVTASLGANATVTKANAINSTDSAQFTGTALVAAPISYVFKSASSITTTSTATATMYGQNYDSVNFAPQVTFDGEPKLKLSGQTEYTHDATSYPQGIATGSQVPGGVKILADGWFAFGGITIEPGLAYKWNVTSNGATTSSVYARPSQRWYGTSILSGAATATGTAVKQSEPNLNMLVKATLAAFTKQYHWPTKILSAKATATSFCIVRHYSGYLETDGTATATADATRLRTAFTGMLPTAGVVASAVQTHAVSTSMSTIGATVTGLVDIQRPDITTFVRTPEIKNFVRTPDIKTFKRIAT